MSSAVRTDDTSSREAANGARASTLLVLWLLTSAALIVVDAALGRDGAMAVAAFRLFAVGLGLSSVAVHVWR